MKTLFLLLCISFSMALAAQDSWKVTHNGKQLLKTTNEDETKNMVTIKKTDLKKTGYLSVHYQGENQQGWKRTIALIDEKDNELIKQNGASFKLSNQKLNTLSDGKTGKIYTWALPTDPKLAAAVRVRRIHLCTIILD